MLGGQFRGKGNYAAKLELIFAPCIQGKRSDTRSNQKKRSRISLTINELFTTSSVVSAIKTMSSKRARHLYQSVEEEHKGSSSIRNAIKEQHRTVPSGIYRDFKILRKCQSKLDCLIYEMLFIKEHKPTLNKRSDSIRAKLFL